MNAIHCKFALVLKLLCLGLLGTLGSAVYAQGPCGGKPCPTVKVTTTHKTAPRSSRPVNPGPRTTRNGPVDPPPRPLPPVCEAAELVVVCGMPGCEITLDGRDRSVTDELGGFTFQIEPNHAYKVRVAKPGYDTYEKLEAKLGCDDQREVKASLTAKPVALRIRTKPAECDIYIDSQKQPSGSDAQGMFSYTLAKPTMLIEARRKGFLSGTKNVLLAPELAGREIVLELEPLRAIVKLSTNVEHARVTIDDQKSAKPVGERLALPPGPHTLTVEALGYAPARLEFSVGPDESVSKEIRLERLSVALLREQAATALNERQFGDVLKLCDFIFEADPADAKAHRLAGQVSLERGDFAGAGSHFTRALTGGEAVTLRVRRHAGEKFDLARGHDACEARLILGKSDVEFQGVRIATDNFKVAYDQIQVSGPQLKSNVALYLGTKVNVGGKRHDFNFYSYDKELSQAGKPYLEMIQQLLRPH